MIFCYLGVRLNKPYSVRVPMDIPVFTGTHADFLVIVSTVEPCCFAVLGEMKKCHPCSLMQQDFQIANIKWLKHKSKGNGFEIEKMRIYSK